MAQSISSSLLLTGAIALSTVSLTAINSAVPTDLPPRANRAPNQRPYQAPTQLCGQDIKDMTDEQRRLFAIENLKRNLDRFPEFVCRYTITDCSAPSLEDAILDRNVERKPALWHVLWIVKKPAERFVVVTKKELLNQPVGRLIAPPGKLGSKEHRIPGFDGFGRDYYPNVADNWLWDGTYQLRVGDFLDDSTVHLGFPEGVHPRTPGTPLEAEFFRHNEPDRLMKDFKEWRASFAGIREDGSWEFHISRPNERSSFKTRLDPRRGFLPVFGSFLAQGRGVYVDWFCTHFQDMGNGSWFTTRSISDLSSFAAKKDGQKPPVLFREFKTEKFDCEKKVAEEDLAITIPLGHEIQMRGGPHYYQMRNAKDRLVDYKQLPMLWNELEVAFWNSKKK